MVKKNKCSASNGKSGEKAFSLSNEKREMTLRQKEAERQASVEREKQEVAKATDALNKLKASDCDAAVHQYDAGKALETIRRDKLYRFVEGSDGNRYKSLKKYVGEKFGITEQYAYMLIKAAHTWEILTDASVVTQKVPEKLLRRLTPLLNKEGGDQKIVDCWKTASGADPNAIPSDKALRDAVEAYRPHRTPSKNVNEILANPDAGANDIINLLRRVANGKTRLSKDDLSKLRDHLNSICDKAECDKDNK